LSDKAIDKDWWLGTRDWFMEKSLRDLPLSLDFEI